MQYLVIVSLVWAFSFGIIKGKLTGLDQNFITLARLGLAFLVFAPFFRPKGLKVSLTLKLLLIGALQYGLMYILYTYSFRSLQAYEVALFTIFTPLFVTFINDLFARRFHARFLLCATLAVAGAAIIKGQELSNHPGMLVCVLALQVSNLCFAFGQVYYKRLLAGRADLSDRKIFAVPYAGGVLAAFFACAIFTDFAKVAEVMDGTKIWALLYLGLVASGLCFFLWNKGARLVDAGSLAVMNDLKIPLGVACSFLFFGEKADLFRLILGWAVIMAALYLNEARNKKPEPAEAGQAVEG